MVCEAFDRPVSYKIIGSWAFAVAGILSSQVREIRELLPCYGQDMPCIGARLTPIQHFTHI